MAVLTLALKRNRIMEPNPTVGLAVTVHQPDERLARLTEVQLPALVTRYAALAAFCSRETHPAILDLLRHHGVSVTLDDGEPRGINGIGDVRRATVRSGLQAGTSHLQMCDFDRAIHWVANFPEELEDVIAGIPSYDLLVLGRTERAWVTHPPYQAETEPLFNKVFALATGLAWDVGAGSRGLSRRAAETLLRLSREMTVGVDAEWPLLLLNREGYRLGHQRCEGLEFETADRFGAEIEAAGGYQAWEAEIDSHPQQWVFRLRVALMISEAVLRYAGGEQKAVPWRLNNA
jgi:hypothetical protein